MKMLGVCACTMLTAVCSADTVTFAPSEVNLGQGAGTGVYGNPTTEWSPFGFTTSNVYLYQDPRDWGPDFNGVAPLSSAGGNILFNVPVNGLSVKWLSLNVPYTITAYDTGGQVLETFTYGAGGNLLGQTAFSVNGIASLNFHDGGGVVSVSEMSFSVVPLPPGALMGCAGLAGVFAVRRWRR